MLQALTLFAFKLYYLSIVLYLDLSAGADSSLEIVGQ
jgi:hypothetical protein